MRVNFEDWHIGQSRDFPTSSGIYCVFSKLKGKLIYIGQASNLRDRIQDHERWGDFERHRDGPYLATTYAKLGSSHLDDVEGRLIKINNPPENKVIPASYYSGTLELAGYVWGLKS